MQARIVQFEIEKCHIYIHRESTVSHLPFPPIGDKHNIVIFKCDITGGITLSVTDSGTFVNTEIQIVTLKRS